MTIFDQIVGKSISKQVELLHNVYASSHHSSQSHTHRSYASGISSIATDAMTESVMSSVTQRHKSHENDSVAKFKHHSEMFVLATIHYFFSMRPIFTSLFCSLFLLLELIDQIQCCMSPQ